MQENRQPEGLQVNSEKLHDVFRDHGNGATPPEMGEGEAGEDVEVESDGREGGGLHPFVASETLQGSARGKAELPGSSRA